MIGQLYIDDIDAYEAYGVWVTEGGYDGLLSFPGLVEPDKNDWPEEDGIEVDLDNPSLKPREVSITLVASVPFRSAYDLISKLSEPGYHTFRIPSLIREWRLRFLSHPDNEEWDTLTSLTLRLAEDVPARPADVTPDGGGSYVPDSGFGLDGVPLDRYGIVVGDGLDDVLRAPAAKVSLTRSSVNMDGRAYDTGQVVFQSKDVTLECCLIAGSMERFWRCYDSFFSALIQPGERTLSCDHTGAGYPCHYKSTSGWRLVSLTGRVMVAFSLTLVLTSYRIDGVEYLLSTGNDALITLEDGETYIDMRK